MVGVQRSMFCAMILQIGTLKKVFDILKSLSSHQILTRTDIVLVNIESMQSSENDRKKEIALKEHHS